MRNRRSQAVPAGVLAVVIAAMTILAGAGAAQADDPIRVGTEGTYPPFSFHDNDDELTGYDVEVMEAVAEEAGWETEFVEGAWDSLFASLDSDKVDTIANQVTISPDRLQQYVFSEPYAFSHGVIVTRAGDDSIKTLADLKGKTAAQSSTSNWSQVAKDAGAKIRNVEQFGLAAELLVQGRVDVIVNDNIAVLDYLERTDTKEIKISGEVGGETSEQALVFRKDDTARAEEATAAIQALKKDGTLAEISERYFGANVTIPDGGEANLEGRTEKGRSTWEVLKAAAPEMLVKLVAVNVPLSLICFAIGLALALVVALARMSGSVWARAPARAFISIIRGTPLLVQLFIVFFGLGQIGIKIDPFLAAVIAFSLNVAGYAAEIVRSAILSVPKGQSEAAATIGMSRAQTLRRVVLPQAARVAVPPLSNSFLSLVKDTALASIVLVTDMFRVAQTYANESSAYLEIYGLAALYFWVVCTILSGLQNRLETRLERYVAK